MDYGLRRSATRPSSESSELTRDSVEQEETSSLDFPITQSISTEWTNEKHSLYLKSMEASFVNQLHNSLDLGSKSSGQFKVLRHGTWQKLNFEKCDSQQNKVDKSHGFLSSPWIRHFKAVGKSHVGVPPNPREGSAKLRGKKAIYCGVADIRSNFSHFSHSDRYHDDMVSSDTEVSDQNFIDEQVEEEKTSSLCTSKKMKTDDSSSDQIVPLGLGSSSGCSTQPGSHNRRDS
ncbi:hypothetical protein ACFE04_006067 [Oxalis oulophora]